MRPLNISGSQAKDYYYGKDPIFETQDNSRWHGELSKQFGLSGQCEEHDFLNVISGSDPNGHQIIKDGVNEEHRAAIDIPLSAPKSISVLALHVGDHKLIDAHHKAVAATIAYIENNYLYARKTDNGTTCAFKTGNGLFATFVHSTSRANDPHLHTHMLTLNMTQTDAGFRAIFNDPIFKDQTLLNYVYQSELAKIVRQLGYGITNESKAKWEIAGFKKEWVDLFSTRAKQIEKTLEQLKSAPNNSNKPDGKLHDQAQKSSRDEKDLTLTQEELKGRWQEKVSREKIREAVEAARSIGHDQQFLQGEYITIAYNAIHENESTFTRQDVVKVALELSRGQYTVGDIEQAFYASVKDRQIEPLRSHINKKGLETIIYTSQKMRLTEQGIVRTFDQNKGEMAAAVEPQIVRQYLEKEYAYFTDGQKKVVENILSSANRFTIVQGDAGTGKTSALEAVKRIIDQSSSRATEGEKIEIIGLGYTGKASREIVNKAGIKSQTLHSFLNKSDAQDASTSRKIWVVDESSMLGSRQMEAIMHRAIKHDATVHFVGDGKQLQAISAGRMFKVLQSRDHVKTIKMEEALRQKTDYMKAAVNYVKEYQNGKSATGIDDAFKVLEKEGRVYEVPSQSMRIEAAAKYFFDHPDRQNCLIVTPVNEDRLAVNEIIHNAVRQKDQAEKSFTIHTPVFLTGTARYFARNYEAGQKAFVEQSSIAGIKPGQPVTISAVDVDKNQLTFSNGAKEHTVDLKKGAVSFSVYNVEERSFFEGEKVVFLKNDEKLNLYNGQTATITKMGPEHVISAKIDGQDRVAKINLAFYPYIDRGYAVTVHKSQGQTAKDVVMVADSKHSNKTETFYVALSRAQNNFTLYADKAEVLRLQFKEAQPKTSTMQIVNDMDKQKDRSRSLER